MAKRAVPLLASDIVRGYIGLLAGTALTFPAGIATGLLMNEIEGRVTERTLTLATLFIGWTAIALLFVVLALAVFGRATPSELRRWLIATTPPNERLKRFWWGFNGGGGIYWAMAGTMLAISALVLIATSRADSGNPLIVATGIAVVVSSMLLIIVSYAVRYAREDATAGGAGFPGDSPRRFADYVYFAAQVSTTFGGSDVELTTTAMRKLVTGHSLVSFAFNTVIVALLVSVLLNAVT